MRARSGALKTFVHGAEMYGRGRKCGRPAHKYLLPREKKNVTLTLILHGLFGQLILLIAYEAE
jgi:hypothetical protein